MRTLSPPWRRVLEGSWIMILVLSIGLVVLYVDNYRMRDCIANYMVADQQNTQARASLGDGERAAFNNLLIVLSNPKTSQEARKGTFEDYIALIQKDDALRKQRPPLPVPTECD